MIERAEFVLPQRHTCRNLPIGDNCPFFHQRGEEGDSGLFDFERGIIAAYEKINSSQDGTERLAAAAKIEGLLTENAYTIGLVQSPAALLVNKRIKNAHPGTPVFMYEWAEDAVIRERLWTPKEAQESETLPGEIAKY